MGCPRQTVVSPARRRHGGSLFFVFSLFKCLFFFFLSFFGCFFFMLLHCYFSLLGLTIFFERGVFPRRNVVVESRNGSFDNRSNLTTNPIATRIKLQFARIGVNLLESFLTDFRNSRGKFDEINEEFMINPAPIPSELSLNAGGSR